MDYRRIAPSTVTIGVCLLGATLRILFALRGNNYDMESWWLASQGVLDGRTVYETTFRYNYGPVWAYILGSLRYIATLFGYDSITSLHVLITLFLSLIDCALAWVVLARSGSRARAILFLFNPISIMVSGYHVQFDNSAILLALLSWGIFLSGPTTGRLLVASLLLGASLATKHVFLLFIPWIVFARGTQTLLARVAYCAGSLALFFGSFAPFLGDPASTQGIRKNVFGYISTEGHSLINAINVAGAVIPDRSLFLVLLSALGVFVGLRCRKLSELPLLYLCALTALSSGMARNYLAIPLVAVCIWLRNPFAPLYLAAATMILLTTNPMLGSTEVTFALSHSQLMSYELAQLLILSLFISRWRTARDS
jgi:hypothetical protein